MTDSKISNYTKDVKGFEDYYEIDTDGNVYRKKSPLANGGRYKLKPSPDSSGYLQITFHIDNERKACRGLHRLLAEHFIPNPENKPQVNHIDGDKTNNDISNLEWVTREENDKHAVEHHLKCHGEDHKDAKLTEKDVLDMRAAHALGWFSYAEIARAYNVDPKTAGNAIKGISWSHV